MTAARILGIFEQFTFHRVQTGMQVVRDGREPERRRHEITPSRPGIICRGMLTCRYCCHLRQSGLTLLDRTETRRHSRIPIIPVPVRSHASFPLAVYPAPDAAQPKRL